jgi:hypothetical protein
MGREVGRERDRKREIGREIGREREREERHVFWSNGPFPLSLLSLPLPL